MDLICEISSLLIDVHDANWGVPMYELNIIIV